MPTTTYNIVGTGSAEFGTGALGTAYGIIVSASKKTGGDKLELKDENGSVFSVVYFNEKNECEISVIFDSTVTLPSRGEAVSLAGVATVLVDEIDLTWSNEKEKQVTIRGTNYVNLVTS